MKKIMASAILTLGALTASAQTLVVYYSRPGQNYTSDGIVNLKKGLSIQGSKVGGASRQIETFVSQNK